MLKIIDEGEAFLHGLGFSKCILRLHNAGELRRIEVPEDGFEVWSAKKVLLQTD